MDFWISEQQARLDLLPDTKRYLFTTLDWSHRCIGLLGARGTGKTTLLLQYIKSIYPDSVKALYIPVDHPEFLAHSLYDFAGDFYRHGGEVLILDEVHKYEDWATHIKSIYDAYPKLRIVFSGSSLLKLRDQNADLSRRAVTYYLHGLSFREYLRFKQAAVFDPVKLEDVFENHPETVKPIIERIRPLEHFQEYLRFGYYPFFLEGKDIYPIKVNEITNQVLERDLPYISNINPRQIVKLKKFLYMLSISVPTKINIQKISSATEISRPKIYEYMEHLKDARLINTIRPVGQGHKVLSKPDKVYLENTNLSFSIAREVDIGTLRESFFVNQIRNSMLPHPKLVDDCIEQSPDGDFLVNGRYTVEVGGRRKGFKQVAKVKDAFVAADGIESGFGSKIPLWLFGFLY